MLDEDGDTLESNLDQTSAATISKMLREALQVRFDCLDEFEDQTTLGPDDIQKIKWAIAARRTK